MPPMSGASSLSLGQMPESVPCLGAVENSVGQQMCGLSGPASSLRAKPTACTPDA